ncbi:glycosyltransferase [Georgenia yuyongxinii]|uniref:Glycosyltransferase n=1 Tax=Georgenia yuyongxinii TaxID=2589797 RepID=A0A5B8C4B6_9MICO|nr:glycosyltransferase [Georgenia yuyongxinii]QDC25599.1 glycosyltransferase [Georgenia yuyongxinii]
MSTVLLSVVVAVGPITDQVDDAPRTAREDAVAATEGSFEAQGDGPWELVLTEGAGSLAARLNAAVARTTGRFVAVVEAGDRLEPGALAAVAGMIRAREGGAQEPGVVYTDEQWEGEGAAGIFIKPRWVPRYLEGYSYLGRLCFVRRDLLDAAGAWRDDHAPVREWDLHLRVTELTDDVVHVPVLGVARVNPPADDVEAREAGRRAVTARYDRRGVAATVELTGEGDEPGGFVRVWRESGTPLVSIVVPTAGGRRRVRGQDRVLVENLLTSLLARTTYPAWEIVLVPSEGTPEDVLERCTALLGERLHVAPVAGPFNFSRSVNTGVAAAAGELVLLLNDDTEVLEPRWLDRMVAVAAEEGVGAVGAKLLFEDGRIQHVGVTFDNAGQAGHAYIFEREDAGHFGSKVVDLDYLAVTGACLLVRRSVYEEVGGFTEALPLNYNDVDFCLKVVASGRGIVCTPFARLYHYESSTRDTTKTADEAQAMDWWYPRTLTDPYVNVRGLG